jgi:hypothetical protein
VSSLQVLRAKPEGKENDLGVCYYNKSRCYRIVYPEGKEKK